MKIGISSAQVGQKAFKVSRISLDWVVGGLLRVGDANCVRTTELLLIIEVELKLVLATVLVVLELEAVAYTGLATRIGVVVSTGVFEELIRVFEVHEFEVWVRVAVVLVLEDLCNDLLAWRVSLPVDQLLKV